MASREMNNAFWLLLGGIQSDENQQYFHSYITTKENICEEYNIGCSYQKFSKSRTTAMKVSIGDKQTINCQSDEYKAKEKRPVHKLRVVYADQELLNPCLKDTPTQYKIISHYLHYNSTGGGIVLKEIKST